MIIGICGKSCSGKTTISKTLAEKFDFKLFHLETNYFRPGSSNWESPEAYNFHKLVNDIQQYRKNLIVEGFLILVNDKLVSLLGKKIYLKLSDKNLVQRRTNRGIESRKDNNPEYLLNTVIPEYRKYEKIQMDKADLILNANLPIENSIGQIIDFCELLKMEAQKVEQRSMF